MSVCVICNDEKTLIVGWSSLGRNDKVKWERDHCPSCTPGPHSSFAIRKMEAINAARAALPPAPQEDAFQHPHIPKGLDWHS